MVVVSTEKNYLKSTKKNVKTMYCFLVSENASIITKEMISKCYMDTFDCRGNNCGIAVF